MAHIAGHHSQLIRECDRGDPKVWFGEWLAHLFQGRPKVAVGMCCDLVKGQHHASVVNELQTRSESRELRRRAAP